MKLFTIKQSSVVSFLLTLFILFGTSNTGYGQDKGQAETINPPLSERTPQIRDAIVAAVPGVNNANDVTAAHLAEITILSGSEKSISALKSGDFNGLTALTELDLSRNSISDISVLENLTSLESLELSHNSISDISVLDKLTGLKWIYLSYNSIKDISVLENLTSLKMIWMNGNSIKDISMLENLTALRKLTLSSNSIKDISVLENLTELDFLWLSYNAIKDVSPLEGLTSLTSLVLSGNPISDLAPLRRLKAANPRVVIDIDISNIAPVFTAGTSTTRSIAENTASDQNIGAVVAAEDDDGDTLTYSLSGPDASSFSIVSTSGQLRTNAALDYETKSSYSVTVTVSDGKMGSDSITVTITVTDVNEAPVFTAGTSTTRSIAENTAFNQNIGAVVAAEDDDGDTLGYSLGGADAKSFGIVTTSGQLVTEAALDYETKDAYTLTVFVSDDEGLSDSITVTITVTDVNEAPVFTAGTSTTRSIAENTASDQNIGDVVAAEDEDRDTLTYSLSGPDASSFSIVSTSGQLRTDAALDFETKSSYSVTVSVSDGKGLSDSITVAITVTDVNDAPVFTAGTSTTRSIAENTASDQNIGAVVAAEDPDRDTLTYSLSGPDASSFSITSTSGQLRTNAALDYETKDAYTVTVSVSDGNGGSDSITVAITVTDVNDAPVFIDGTSTTRAVPENTAPDQNIGAVVAAEDEDRDTLTYSLSGKDASSFSILSGSGQLQTKEALDFETKSSYSVTVSVSDGNGGSDSITVRISVTAVKKNNAPRFIEGSSTTRAIAENTASDQNIGAVVAAKDANNDTLFYSLSGPDASSFSIVSTSGQLRTEAALDYETKDAYTVTVSVSDGNGGSNSITVAITVTDVNDAPVFTAGTSTTRSIAENTASNQNIGAVVAAEDDDSDTLTYSLSGKDASSFSIVSTSGQLQTEAALDYETKSSYSVTVSVSDGNGLSDSITVAIAVTDVNEAPVFSADNSTAFTLTENTAPGTDIGSPFSATDPDNNDTLFYSLSGPDGSAFSIVSASGQLRTEAALDYETKDAYTVTVSVSDGNGGSDSIAIAITPTDVNDAPVFTDGTSTTRAVPENIFTQGRQVIEPAVGATDDDSDTLTYSLSGPDASSFIILSASGELQTKAALDYETKSSYSVTVSVSDGNGGSDSITVTITVTNVNEFPVFTAGTSTTRAVPENTASNQNIGAVVAAEDPDRDTLTYSLGGPDWFSFSIVSTSGQLLTKAALDYETKSSYSVTVFVSDDKGLSDSITVAITVTDANDAPVFTAGTSTTRSIAENAASGQNIGAVVAAEDPDRDTLTYSLSGPDASSFSIVSTSGQLLTKAALDYETKSSYSVTVSVSDGNGLSDSITVTINVTDWYPLYGRTQQVQSAIVAAVPGVNSANDVTAAHLEAITILLLSDKHITSLKSNDFDGLTTLEYLGLYSNDLRALPSGIFDELTALENLSLDYNALSSLPSGIFDELTALEILSLSNNNISDISELEDLTSLISLGIDSNPISDYGPLRRLKAANPKLLIDIDLNNNPPVFSDGDSTMRSIAENTVAGTNIGIAVSATDADDHTLTYSLEGTDADSFDIVSNSGQLQTKDDLDYETKLSYTVTVTVYDGNSGGDKITVTINVTDAVGAAPSAQVSPVIPDNTALLTNFPNPFNPETWIPYQLAKPADVTLTIYDIRGVVVRELKLGYQSAGVYTNRSRAIHWDGRNNIGEQVATGVYFYTLKAGDFTATRKLLIRK